eukprot:bmy_20268T0
MAAGPEPPEWEPRWRKALRGKLGPRPSEVATHPITSISFQENKGSVEIMRKDLNDARDLHGQAESAAAVWKASGGHVMDRRKKALTDYKKLRAFFAEEEGRFLQEAEKEEGSLDDEDEDPAERFRSLLQAVSELERRHRNLGLSMLLQVFMFLGYKHFTVEICIGGYKNPRLIQPSLDSPLRPSPGLRIDAVSPPSGQKPLRRRVRIAGDGSPYQTKPRSKSSPDLAENTN